VEDAPRQHVSGHLNSQRLTGVGVPSGQRYNVNFITNNIFNARVDGANVTTIEAMMNTINANGETTTQFQNFHVHCTG
jgi:hypothetical protein